MKKLARGLGLALLTVHVDVLVPTRTKVRDWGAWLPPEVPTRPAGYVAFGWGDRGFYLNTPTWEDLSVGTAAYAVLVPSETAMHVAAWPGPPRSSDRVHRLGLTTSQYEALVVYLDASFALDANGRPRLIDHPGYNNWDRFFVGQGHYHLLNTCNVWSNGAVRATGHRSALWSPFEWGARYHLPENRGR